MRCDVGQKHGAGPQLRAPVLHAALRRRLQVTDTTTFTSEARRQQEDAWLYETCTLCLQYLVDVFVMVGAH